MGRQLSPSSSIIPNANCVRCNMPVVSGTLKVWSSPEILFSVSLSVARVAVDRFRLEALDAAVPDCLPDWPRKLRRLSHPFRLPPDWLERAPTQASSSCASKPCPPVSGPSASDLRGEDSPTVSWGRDVRVFHIGNFPSPRSFLICLDRSCLEPSTNVLPRITHDPPLPVA